MAAFHGDETMQGMVRSIVEQAGIGAAVETGTFDGDSALFLRDIAQQVYTIEARDDYYTRSWEKFRDRQGIVLAHGRSQELLPGILALALANARRVLVFLDAHWQDDWPLRNELEACEAARIAHPGSLVVIADDLAVPGREADFYGCDGGGGTLGDPAYGPRMRPPRPGEEAHHRAFADAFARYVEEWVPDYGGGWPGYVIASDIPLALCRREFRRLRP